MILMSIISFIGCTEKNEPDMDLLIEKSIEEFNNRKIYKKLTAPILVGVKDDELEQTIIDNIYEIVGDNYENEFENVSKLTKGQQAVFSTWWLEAEVNNGGFNQFYFNSTGKYAAMAEKGFKTIGALKLSELTSLANKIFNENKERIEGFDDGTLEGFSESYNENPLNDLAPQFYELYDLENISELRIKYIRENTSEFTTNLKINNNEANDDTKTSMLLWEDDYLMVEIMSSNNLEFAKMQIGEIPESTELKQIKTKELQILKTDLAELMNSVELNEYEKISYAGIGEPHILENPKSRAFGDLSSAIFFDGDADKVENIWLSSHNWAEVNNTNILNGLNAIGNKYNMILVDIYPIQNKIVDLKNKTEIQNYLDIYVKRFTEKQNQSTTLTLPTGFF